MPRGLLEKAAAPASERAALPETTGGERLPAPRAKAKAKA
jgi:hypothetical protein